MRYYVVLEGNDEFIKEEYRDFGKDSVPRDLKYRRYPRLDTLDSGRLQVEDRIFYLQSSFYALGRHILYYKE